jgi:hypothetical protein
VIKRNLGMTACAFSCAAAVLVSQPSMLTAQQPDAPRTVPQPGAPPAPAPSADLGAAQPRSTVFVGCLYREEQVAGRTPNVAEKAGVLEDYILANAAPANAVSAERGGTPRPTGTSGSTAGVGAMYKIEKIPDDQLKALVGKRVEVTGRIDPEGSTTKIDVPELEGASIREISGACPASPVVAPAPAR